MAEELTASRPSIRDIAKAAGVSTSTVSRVFNRGNKYSSISEEAYRRVMDAANELRYRPNLLARNLRTRKTKTIGLIVSDVEDPFVATIVKGTEKAIRQAGYVCTLANAAHSTEGQRLYADFFAHSMVDGILMTGFAGPRDDEALFPFISDDPRVLIRIPVVLIGHEFRDDRIVAVTADNVRGAREAVEHLLNLGHRRIVYIKGNHHHSELRLQGYREAFRVAGLTVDPGLVLPGGNTAQEGYWAMKSFLQKSKPPTAVFCFSDLIAFGAIRALAEGGLGVPDHCSVVGFDNIEVSAFSNPPLTTVTQPGFQMGYLAADWLTRLIGGETFDEKRKIILPTELVIRSSTTRYRS